MGQRRIRQSDPQPHFDFGRQSQQGEAVQAERSDKINIRADLGQVLAASVGKDSAEFRLDVRSAR
jgi:hypothetical protein